MTDMSAYLASRNATAPHQNYQTGQQADVSQQQEQKRAETAQQAQQATQQAEMRQRALFAYMGAHKGHEDEIIAANPSMFPGIARPTLTPTPDEQFHNMITNDSIKTFPALPESARQTGTFKNAYDVLPPTDTVKLLNAQDVTAHPQQWTPEVAQRQAIEDKRALDAKDAAVVPSENALRTAQAANQMSDVRKNDADTAFTSGPKTGLTRAEQHKTDVQSSNFAEEAAFTHARTEGQQIQNSKDTAQAGTSNSVVSNYIANIKSAIASGSDPSPIMKSITDPKIKQQVSVELNKPENASLQQAVFIPAAAREAIASIDPLILQARKVQRAYESYKGQNGLLDRDTIDYGLYRMGTKPPDNSPISEVANTQMLGVQAGARLLKGGSRAYPALKMAMQHAPDGAVDTRANIYDKSGKLITQLVNVRNAELGWNGSPSVAPPVGAMRVMPNQELGRWDGVGWEKVP